MKLEIVKVMKFTSKTRSGHYLFNITFDDNGSIHGWGTTFRTKDLRTTSHWISAFIMDYYYLINKF